MIAHTWHRRVPLARADAYDALLITLWDSVEAVKRFAGEDYLRARCYPLDDDYLLEREQWVTHFEVLLLETGGQESGVRGLMAEG
jgi:hypothetical protein